MFNLKSIRRNLTLCLVTTLSLTAVTPAFAESGGTSSGGGDPCEARIQNIRDDIRNWINLNGPQKNGLKLPADLSFDQYSQKMSQVMTVYKHADGSTREATNISCVHKPIQIQGNEKVCRFDKVNGLQITCYFEAFMNKTSMTEDDQYELIHHEYAGLAGLENPAGDQSNYSLSNQIAASLENQTIKKLAVKDDSGTNHYRDDYDLSYLRQDDSLSFQADLSFHADSDYGQSTSYFDFDGKVEKGFGEGTYKNVFTLPNGRGIVCNPELNQTIQTGELPVTLQLSKLSNISFNQAYTFNANVVSETGFPSNLTEITIVCYEMPTSAELSSSGFATRTMTIGEFRMYLNALNGNLITP